MADDVLAFEDAAPPPAEPAPATKPAVLSFEEATKPPPTADPRGPMPGAGTALLQGIGTGLKETIESGKTVAGQTPAAVAEPSRAAESIDWWSDPFSPYSKFLPKVAYGLGKSAPTLAAGFFGGISGGGLGTLAAGPAGTAPGALAGGILGSAVGAAFQIIGPVFAEELKKAPNDPDGAWDRARERAAVSGAFSGAAWAAFPMRFFQGPLKQFAMQAFGIQPGISMAEQATQNVVQGRPIGEDVLQAYGQGVAGTAVPMAGHAILRAALPSRGAPPGPSPTTHAANIQRTTGELAQLQGDHAVLTQQHQNEIAQYGPTSPEAMETEQAIHQNLRDQHTAGERLRYAQLGIPEEGPAREIDFKAPVPGQGPDPSTWSSGPFWGVVNRTKYRWKKTFQPEEISDLALQSQGIFREYGSATRQRKDAIQHWMDRFHSDFEKLSTQEQIDYMKAAANEQGYQVPPELQPAHNIFRTLLDMVHRQDKDAGSKLGWIEDYFPRQFKSPEQAAQWIQAKRASMTKPGFQKARSLEFLQDAFNQGIELVTYNPADLVANRLIAGADMQERVKLLRRVNQMGAAAKLMNEGDLAAAKTAGWHLIKDPAGQAWALHPDLKPMWDNIISNRGLWDNPTTAGNVFRGWMQMKNLYVVPKLALSFFHPLHVSHINLVDGLTRAWQQIGLNPNSWGGALHSALKGVYGQIAQATPYLPTEAKAARAAWLTPEWAQTPEQKAVVKLMVEGGFSPQLSEELRTYDSRKFRDALINQQWFKALPYGLRQILPSIQKPIFEHWIPSLKTAAYLDSAKELLARRPDLIDDPVNRKVALGTIAKSIDNRYGEMFYKNVFWNKVLKEAGIGSFLSLGWNLGFVREFGGGVLEPFLKNTIDKTPTRQAISDAKSKTAFALFYFVNAAIINAMISKMIGGVNVQDMEPMDYFLPRISGTNPDGTPRRVSNMFYTREIPMAQKHIEEKQGNVFAGLRSMLWNKMMFEPFYEFYNNRDYYGFNIWNESAPWYQQAYQMGRYILSDSFSPITITGAKNALQKSGKWDENDSLLTKMKKIVTEPEGQAAIAGFGPAPAYASKSAALNRLSYLFQRYVAPHERPEMERDVMEARHDARIALDVARQNKDAAAATRAAQRLVELGVGKKAMMSSNPDVYMFTRLPYSIQTEFLKDLPPAEFKRYYPKANRNTRADREIQALAKAYFNP